MHSASSECICPAAAAPPSPEQQHNRSHRILTPSSAAPLVGGLPSPLAFHQMLTSLRDQLSSVTGDDDDDGMGALIDMLAECGMALWQGRWERARDLVRQLWRRSAPDGDATERMASHLTDVLAVRLLEASCRSLFSDDEQQRLLPVSSTLMPSEDRIQAASLSFNQATPYLRFVHLTANQAILEAMEGKQRVHIVDIEIMQGLQWPPLMQSMAERSGGAPRSIRITAGGRDAALLDQVGERLRGFAQSLGFDSSCFEYESIQYGDAGAGSQRRLLDDLFRQGSHDDGGCMVVINSILQLGDLPWAVSSSNVGRYGHINPSSNSSSPYLWRRGAGEDSEAAMSFQSPSALLWEIVARIGGRRFPALLTVAEPQADFSAGGGGFAARFGAALRHYAALFESLEATLPPACAQRVAVEGVWLKSQLARLVLGSEGGRGMMTQEQQVADGGGGLGAGTWMAVMAARGLRNVAPSGFALSQARLLLRLRYASEGYVLHSQHNRLLLGWQDTPLFGVSAWLAASTS